MLRSRLQGIKEIIQIKEQSFERQIEKLAEKHLPVGFIDYKFLCDLLCLIKDRESISRREILILSYMIGISSDEADSLLKCKGLPPLYVKKYEDAIWRFALDKKKDPSEIIDLIFCAENEETDNHTDI